MSQKHIAALVSVGVVVFLAIQADLRAAKTIKATIRNWQS